MTNFSFELESILRLLISMVCGALIGLERERGHRPAGLRTHTLVCVGACLVMVTSFWALERYGLSGDPFRMGSQVISGIGFLGAGTIIKAGKDVRGLTTAACLWIAACIGLAIGAGYYLGGALTTLLILVMLHLFKIAERRLDYQIFEIAIYAQNKPDVAATLTETLQGWKVQINNFSVSREESELCATAVVHLPMGLNQPAFFSKLMDLPFVLRVSDQPEQGADLFR